MRRIAIALLAVGAGTATLGGCSNFLTASGSAATRWAALEKSRAAKAAGGDAGKICKTMPVMGSNFPQKVCSAQAEWDAFDDETRQSVDDFDNQRRSGNTDSAFEGG